jgi:S-adenosylhomocysteine hydrolase
VDLGCPVIAVDYDDIDALQAVLEEHQIYTVISALALHFIGVGKAQTNLIKAADKSEPTKRFVASNWAVRPEHK